MGTQRGATLIEVLITVLVLSVGLLGLGATQMLSLKNGNNAQQTYYATMAAYDIVERMRANPVGNYTVADFDESDTTQQSCATNACSSGDLATMDLFEWGQLLSANLPGASADIAVNGNRVTVDIEWTAQHTGEKLSSKDGGGEIKTFQLVTEL